MSTQILAWLARNGWALNLVFIALGSYFTAGAANAVVARSIRSVPTVSDIKSAPPVLPGEPLVRVKGEFASMAERNLMALKREDLTPKADAEEAADEAKEIDMNNLRPCSVPASLRATIVADGAPEWSIAVMYNNTTREAEVYTVNEGSNQIVDDATLVEIRSREVLVRRRDHYERCMAEGEAAPAPEVMSAPPMMESPGEEGGGEGVTKVSGTEYNIDRNEIDRVLSNLNEVATQARIVPSFKNGKANGFKLFSIKPGSIYSKIGLQNGDVIQQINGYEMNSPDKALEIYQKLRTASSVSVDLQRRGRPMSFSYTIR